MINVFKFLTIFDHIIEGKLRTNVIQTFTFVLPCSDEQKGFQLYIKFCFNELVYVALDVALDYRTTDVMYMFTQWRLNQVLFLVQNPDPV